MSRARPDPAREGLRPARSRRRRVPDGDEVVVRAAGHRQAHLRHRQLRRIRAGHLQQPRARRARAAPDDRGHDDRGVRDRLPHGVRLQPRRVPVAGGRAAAALDEVYAKGYLGSGILGSDYDLDIVLHRGAGAYICGEETALLSSLEGLRGQPRLRPPFPAVEGLYESPTVINNVETLCERARHRRAGRGLVQLARAPRSRPGRRCSRSPARSSVPATTSSRMGTPFRGAARGGRGRHARRRAAEGVHPRRLVHADAHRRAHRRRPGLRVDRRGRLAARYRARSW